MLELFVYLLIFVLTFLVSGNNLSVCTGTAYGSGIVTKKIAIILGITGYLSGFVLQGYNMAKGPGNLLYGLGNMVIVDILVVTIAIFIIAHFIKIPTSMVMVLTGSIFGIFFGINGRLPVQSIINISLLWITAPIVIIASSYIINVYLDSKYRSRSHNIWNIASFYKITILILTFFFAYAFGANTVGLIAAVSGNSITSKIIIGIALIFGPLLLSGGELKRISAGLYLTKYSVGFITLLTSSVAVEISTFLGLPISNTQTITSAMLGSAFGEKMRMIKIEGFLALIASWVIAPFSGFVLSMVLVRI